MEQQAATVQGGVAPLNRGQVRATAANCGSENPALLREYCTHFWSQRRVYLQRADSLSLESVLSGVRSLQNAQPPEDSRQTQICPKRRFGASANARGSPLRTPVKRRFVPNADLAPALMEREAPRGRP